MIQILMSVLGTIGFAIYFNVGIKRMFGIAMGGFLSWSLYLLIIKVSNSIFTASFLTSVIICIYAEIMARVEKTPATIFLIPSVISLLPGSSFYYAMAAALNMSATEFRQHATGMITISIGITSGIVIGAFVFSQILSVIAFFKRRRFNENNSSV